MMDMTEMISRGSLRVVPVDGNRLLILRDKLTAAVFNKLNFRTS